MGLEVIFVDAGINNNGVLEFSEVGSVDDRSNFKLITSHPLEINTCDIVVCHTGVPDNWLVKNQIPIIWVIHGRPRACYIPEFNGNSNAYTLVKEVSSWNRTKKVIHFWQEFYDNWKFSIPDEKHVVLSTPCIDETRFKSTGDKYEIQNKGNINILIAESHREDIDIYETLIQCLNNCIEGIKYHFFALEKFENPVHQHLLSKLQEKGCLGDVHARVTNMELVYRSMNILLSPQRIATRSVLEAHASGLVVIADLKNKLAHYTIDFRKPTAFKTLWELEFPFYPNKMELKQDLYKKEMMEVYDSVKQCR
jgi:hypothetical protein